MEMDGGHALPNRIGTSWFVPKSGTRRQATPVFHLQGLSPAQAASRRQSRNRRFYMPTLPDLKAAAAKKKQKNKTKQQQQQHCTRALP